MPSPGHDAAIILADSNNCGYLYTPWTRSAFPNSHADGEILSRPCPLLRNPWRVNSWWGESSCLESVAADRFPCSSGGHHAHAHMDVLIGMIRFYFLRRHEVGRGLCWEEYEWS